MPGGHARFDGPSLSIGCLNNSPPRMNVRNGWRRLHLAHLPATRSVTTTDTQRDGPEIYYVRGGSIFGKATKVAIKGNQANGTFLKNALHISGHRITKNVEKTEICPETVRDDSEKTKNVFEY